MCARAYFCVCVNSIMPYLLKATLLAGAASSALASSQTALVDAPYVETIPFQFVYQDSPLPRAPKWGVLPEKCCVGQVAAVADSRTLLKFDQSGTLCVLSLSPAGAVCRCLCVCSPVCLATCTRWSGGRTMCSSRVPPVVPAKLT